MSVSLDSPRSRRGTASRSVVALVSSVLVVLLLATVVAAPAVAQEAGDGERSEEEKVLYALGLMLSQQIAPFDFGAEELEVIREGFTDGALGRDAEVDLSAYGPKVQAMVKERAGAGAEKERVASAAFVEEQKEREGAEVSESGLIYVETEAGTGESPTLQDTVRVHYEGRLRTGEVFDSSYQRGEPAEFKLGQVIQCWQEGVAKMKEGGKATLICPADLAYGERATATIPANAALVFDIELLEIVE